MMRNLSVRHKFTAVAVATTAIVLVLASAAFVALEINNYRRALVQELSAIAQITASNLTAAIIFDDRAAAHETLAALSARPNIEFAAIYTPDGELFAQHIAGATGNDADWFPASAPSLLAEPPGADRLTGERADLPRHGDLPYALTWTTRSVDLYGPIELDGETIGAIRIHSSLDQIGATVVTYLAVALSIIALAIAFAWLLAARLQRQITLPIFCLLDTMGTVARQRDYTQRAQKYGDDELGALVDGFNDMLAETEVHRAELNRARQEAESASRLKSEFLAHMSHELRTPLNAILGFSDFMIGEPHGPLGHDHYREYMRDIRNGGQHLLGVINDILDLSKMEAVGLDLREEVFDVEALINECVRLLRERADNAGIELRTQVRPRLPHLYGDAQLLKRGLLNLLSNAIKFTPAEGKVIVRAGEAPDGRIFLAVVDTGIGIAPHQIEHVLTPFGQAENVFCRTHDGTGLGLPLVKSFIELHGGALELQSVPGAGTTVTLRFPAERTRPRRRDELAAEDETVAVVGAAKLALSA